MKNIKHESYDLVARTSYDEATTGNFPDKYVAQKDCINHIYILKWQQGIEGKIKFFFVTFFFFAYLTGKSCVVK